jgi:hypothetical protein
MKTNRTSGILTAAVMLAAAPVWAAGLNVEAGHTEGFGGFGAIDHVGLSIPVPLSANIQSTLRLEHRRQAGSATSSGASGTFLEGIFNYPLGTSLYGMTRIGFTDENTLFTDNSLYQELGWRAMQWGPVFVDLNGGIGTRQFTTGTETFVSAGPTFSWAQGALWLRREQSASGGGHRNLLTVRQEVWPRWHIELTAMEETRRKFTLPLGPGVVATNFDGERYSLGVWHQLTAGAMIYAKAEKISLERPGTPGRYYAPKAFAVGINLQF